MPPYKTIFIPAFKATYEKDSLLFGTKTVTNEYFIDGQSLAADCEAACNELHEEGYEVVSVTELSRGNADYTMYRAAGWTMTAGVLITARLRAQA